MALDQALIDLLCRGIADGVFPGATALVIDGDRTAARIHAGDRMTTPQRLPMELDTLFDLASLTKPVATATVVALLVEDGALSTSDPVTRHLPEFARDDVTILHLLTHTSGLPAWKPLYLDPGDRDEIVAYLGALPPEHPVGEKIVYSCLGYILLAELVKAVTGRSVGDLATERIFDPLGMRATAVNPPGSLRESCAATENRSGAEQRMTNYARYDWRDGVVWGVVHDENAHFLGGDTGNAGLFATLDDLGLFARCLLNEGAPIMRPETHRLLTDVVMDDGETRRTHAWIALDDGSLTHTGFTGTALRWRPAERQAAILLTNRVHPDATTPGIVAFRREFFAAAFDGLSS
jgi:CubicO group peptidase (beta-lactamase class C family)